MTTLGPGGEGRIKRRPRRRPIRLEANLRALPSAAFLLDPDGLILAWNPAAEVLLELPEEAAVGRHWAEIEPAARLPELGATLPDLHQDGDPRVTVVAFRRHDGTLVRARLALTSVVNDEGSPAAVLAVIEDQSPPEHAPAERLDDDEVRWRCAELEQLNQVLQERLGAVEISERQKTHFLAVLAHELRNPLAPVLTAMRVIGLQAPHNTVIGQARRVVERQVKHLARMLDDLLDVSRVTQGKVVIRREPTDLGAVASEALEATRHAFEMGGQRLSVHLPEQPLVVSGDPGHLLQVVTNLLHNAARYTEPGGQVSVEAASEGQDGVLTVRDTGLGIAPEVLPHIFDLFTQVHSPGGGTRAGLGIGLALAKSLVELHGGQVVARSEGLGLGSEFIVRLPLAAGPVVPESAGEPGRAAPGRPLHILVIEDSRDAREMLRTLLELEGHRVVEARNGTQGIEAASQAAPDVVLLDIGLPGMDGFEVAQRLRKLLGAAVFLVALTGYGDGDTVRRARLAGFDRHLVKPVDPARLVGLFAERRRRSA